MQLRQYASILWRRKWLILAVVATAVGFLLRSGGLATPTPQYRARATILVTAPPGRTLPYPVEAIRSQTVVRRAMELANIQADSTTILEDIRVVPRKDASVVDIDVVRFDPKQAADLANGLAAAYVTKLAALAAPDAETLRILREAHEQLGQEAGAVAASGVESTRKELELRWIYTIDELVARSYADIWMRQVLTRPETERQILQEAFPGGTPGVGLPITPEASLLELASPPDRPLESPILQRARLIGGVAGVALIAALTLAFGIEHVDDRIRTTADAAKATGLRVLVSLPSRWRIRRAIKKFRSAGRKVGRFDGAVTPGPSLIPDPKFAEAFQSLRVQIDLVPGDQDGGRVILIASPGNGGDKTVVAALLGAVLAQAGKRVVLVSADLHNRGLEAVFSPEDERGIAEVAAGMLDPMEVLRRSWIPNLGIVPAGSGTIHPADVLASPTTDLIFESAKAVSDVVIVEAPPVLAGEEAALLVPHCDAVILVLESGETTTSEAAAAKAVLEKVQNGASFLGAVMTGVPVGRKSRLYNKGRLGHRSLVGSVGRRA